MMDLLSLFDIPMPLAQFEDAKTKSRRQRLTREQTFVLKAVYEHNFFPSKELQTKLSTELNIPIRTLQVWFQNQRQYHRLKMKRLLK